jgi:hypothetical protein
VDSTAEFVRSRLAQEEKQAQLFHELHCPVPVGRRQFLACRCPCPRRLLERIAAKYAILSDCERQILCLDDQAPGWLIDSLHARQLLGAIALPYELHPDWREQWRP